MQIIEPGPYLLKGLDTRYPSPHDVNLRLTKTIVRWQGRPVFVNGLYDTTMIAVWDMVPGSKHFVVDANDSRLDISSPPLGFMIYREYAYYAARRPLRSQRQGLDVERMMFYDLRTLSWVRFSRDDEVLESMRKMLLREYPKISEFNDQKWKSMPISRTWAIKRMPSKRHSILYHKAEAVGYFDLINRQFKILPDFRTRLRLNSLSEVLAKQYGEHYEIV